jgi:hypothetical protein
MSPDPYVANSSLSSWPAFLQEVRRRDEERDAIVLMSSTSYREINHREGVRNFIWSFSGMGKASFDLGWCVSIASASVFCSGKADTSC